MLPLLALAPLIFVLLVIGGGWWFSVTPYRGAKSDHFDGRKFRNPPGGRARSIVSGRPFGLPAPPPLARKTRSSIGAAQIARVGQERRNGRGAWTRVDEPPGPAPMTRVPRDEMRVTMVNHATLLVQAGGFNFLTDPVFAKRASPLSWAGPSRWRNPGIPFEDLPPLDAVLLSHNHYDHLDAWTLARMAREKHPRVITGLGNGATLRSLGFNSSLEMDWWDTAEIAPGLTVHCVPGQHFSGRGFFDRDKTLWCGFVVETAGAGSFYFSGDTGWGPHFAQIGKRFPGIRLAMLPIGAYRPEWFMSPVHTGPLETIDAHRAVGAQTSIPFHYGTFALGIDGMDEARDILMREVAAVPDAQRPDIRIATHGQAIVLPAGARAAA